MILVVCFPFLVTDKKSWFQLEDHLVAFTNCILKPGKYRICLTVNRIFFENLEIV